MTYFTSSEKQFPLQQILVYYLTQRRSGIIAQFVVINASTTRFLDNRVIQQLNEAQDCRFGPLLCIQLAEGRPFKINIGPRSFTVRIMYEMSRVKANE